MIGYYPNGNIPRTAIQKLIFKLFNIRPRRAPVWTVLPDRPGIIIRGGYNK